MNRLSGFVTVMALILLVLLGFFGVSMLRHAQYGLDIARNFHLHTQELALAEAGTLVGAAMLLRENNETALVEDWLGQDSSLNTEDILALSEEQWQAKDLGLFPEVFIFCQCAGRSRSDSLDISSPVTFEFHLFGRAAKNPYGPIVKVGVRKLFKQESISR